MNPDATDRLLRAQDIFPVWRKRIRAAERSIIVFTPFLNDLLVKLLSESIKVQPDDILVVTDFRHEALLDHHPAQLLAIKALLDRGIAVKSLPLLHAKVLLTDNEHVVLGSQNFTAQGRKNKEASFVSADGAQDSRFVVTLLEWAETAEPIDPDRVKLLIDRLDPPADRLRKTKEEIEAEVDAIVADRERQNQEEHRRRLDEQERRSTIRLAKGAAFASLGTAISCDFAGFPNEYTSLLVERGYDLTNWIKSDGKSPVRLGRLMMYPLLMEKTLRMGLARIGRTRITYVWNDCTYHKPLEVGICSFKIFIQFPPLLQHNGNIKVSLRAPEGRVCEFHLRFTGYSLDLTYQKFAANCGMMHQRVLEREFFAHRKKLKEFFCEYFESFEGRNFIHSKNVQDFFSRGRHRLSLIEYESVPILLARKC
jgi:hypothetical protein